MFIGEKSYVNKSRKPQNNDLLSIWHLRGECVPCEQSQEETVEDNEYVVENGSFVPLVSHQGQHHRMEQ